MEHIYCDYNSTTPVDESVVDAMAPFWRGDFGNPASPHRFGRKALAAVEKARHNVARMLGASDDEIVFTSGATESNNMVIQNATRGIITSMTEHGSVYEPCRRLADNGRKVVFLGCDRAGRIALSGLEKALTSDTCLVSLILANHETGVILEYPEKFADAAHNAGALFHLDATQAAGKIPVDVHSLGADFVSLSAHKIYGPKGIGALYVRRGVRLESMMSGGGHESGMRPGTLNVTAIVGFGRAAEMVVEKLDVYAAHYAECRDMLEREILKKHPSAVVHGAGVAGIPNTLNISFPGFDGVKLASALDTAGIAVSTGSACSTDGISRVILASGASMLEAAGTLRFSVGRGTTFPHIRRIVTALDEILKKFKIDGVIDV